MEVKRRIGVGTLVLIAVIMSTIGGGLVGGVAGYRLARLDQPTPQAIVQPTTGSGTPRPTSISSPINTNAEPIVETVKRVSPAVVTVLNTLSGRPAGGNQATGSGVIINPDGYIVTNNHVVEGAFKLQVIFYDGTVVDATLVGTDELADLAVIKVEATMPGVIALGDSDQLQPGQTVIAIGSPLGTFKNSVTTGVISALNRSIAETRMEGLIQTDAAINHGNSGGPLINLNGEVVGINTLVIRGDSPSGDPTDIAQGLGFAVPSNTIKMVTDQLIATGKVERPYIGIEYSMITRELAASNSLPVQQGARLSRVTLDGPAAAAGLLEGDIITKIDGDSVDEQHTLQQRLFHHTVGEAVLLKVIRDGSEIEVSVTLAARPAGLR